MVSSDGVLYRYRTAFRRGVRGDGNSFVQIRAVAHADLIGLDTGVERTELYVRISVQSVFAGIARPRMHAVRESYRARNDAEIVAVVRIPNIVRHVRIGEILDLARFCHAVGQVGRQRKVAHRDICDLRSRARHVDRMRISERAFEIRRVRIVAYRRSVICTRKSAYVLRRRALLAIFDKLIARACARRGIEFRDLAVARVIVKRTGDGNARIQIRVVVGLVIERRIVRGYIVPVEIGAVGNGIVTVETVVVIVSNYARIFNEQIVRQILVSVYRDLTAALVIAGVNPSRVAAETRFVAHERLHVQISIDKERFGWIDAYSPIRDYPPAARIEEFFTVVYYGVVVGTYELFRLVHLAVYEIQQIVIVGDIRFVAA